MPQRGMCMCHASAASNPNGAGTSARCGRQTNSAYAPCIGIAATTDYITAYQMLHRFAKVKPEQRVLYYGASGGVGTAQLGRLAALEMYLIARGAGRFRAGRCPD
jgi:NADPH-dependent curcumin reductase CurA